MVRRRAGETGFTAALKPTTIATLETKAGTKVTCKKLTAKGEITGNQNRHRLANGLQRMRIGRHQMQHRRSRHRGHQSQRTRRRTRRHHQRVPHTKDKIGNVLWPKGGTPTSGAEFVEFACGALTVKVKNSVISPVTSNAMKLTATVKYTAAKGVQKPTKFEGGPNMFLESKFSAAPYEQSGQSATTIQTNEEKVEIRSL